MDSLRTGDVAASSKATALATEPFFDVKGVLKEIAFGSIAGMVSEMFEYPFDLAKVRLQAQLLAPSGSSNATSMRFEGPLHCLIQTYKEEGIRGLYRGLPLPIAGSMVETASVFLAYSSFQNVIRSFSSTPGGRSKTSPLSLPQLGLASAGAGFLTSFVLTPIELVKCKMQVQMMAIHPPLPATSAAAPTRMPQRSTSTLLPSANIIAQQSKHDMAFRSHAAAQLPKLPGIFELTRSIIHAEGFRGLWLGHTGTLLRETGGCAAWFMSKEWIARKLIDRRLRTAPPNAPRPSTTLLTWESGVSGAIAGAIGALVLYPADTVKSAIQTEEELFKAASKSGQGSSLSFQTKSTFFGTFRRMWVTHGMKGLYAGCGMTVARAVPSSGIVFVVYDGLTAWFS